jgi:hypothetical protein
MVGIYLSCLELVIHQHDNFKDVSIMNDGRDISSGFNKG